MTTINEFEQQKQEIINECTKIIKGFGVGILDGLDNIVEKTKNLHAPKPTCSTCNKYDDCNVIHHIPNININRDFGCTHHSNYGEN